MGLLAFSAIPREGKNSERETSGNLTHFNRTLSHCGIADVNNEGELFLSSSENTELFLFPCGKIIMAWETREAIPFPFIGSCTY